MPIPNSFHLLGMGGFFLLLIPNPFSAFGYGRTFLIAYTQSIFTFWVWADISYCLYPIHFWFLGIGGHFLLPIPNPFSAFGYGRTFLIAYTQSIFTFWVWADISYCLYPIHFQLLGMGGYFLLLIPNPFSPFGYGRTFPIAYTQSIFTFWVWADISYCLCPIHFHLLSMGGHFLLLIPNPFLKNAL